MICELSGRTAGDLNIAIINLSHNHQVPPEEFDSEGALSSDAAKILLNALYGVRFVRYNLLWTFCNLSR